MKMSGLNWYFFAYFMVIIYRLWQNSAVPLITECVNSKAYMIGCSNLDVVIIPLMCWLAQSHSKHDRCSPEKEPAKTFFLNPLVIYDCPGNAPLVIDRSTPNIRECKRGTLSEHLAASCSPHLVFLGALNHDVLIILKYFSPLCVCVCAWEWACMC